MAQNSDKLQLPSIVDVDSPSWTSDACLILRSWGFARLRMSPSEAALVQELYDSMDAVFQDEHSGMQLEIPDADMDRLDQRSGYVFGKHRHMLELHPGCSSVSRLCRANAPCAVRLVCCAKNFAATCEKWCDEALRELANCCEHLNHVLCDNNDQLKVIDNMLRVYRYKESYDRPDGDIGAHYDMGLLTIIPKSSSPGLKIQPPGSKKWCSIEDYLAHDEVLLFGGMTLARLSGIPALLHGIFTDGKFRLSAPFFQRMAPECQLPASPGHPEETVKRYNRRLRDADNEELRSDGRVVFRRRSRRRDSRTPSRTRSELHRHKAARARKACNDYTHQDSSWQPHRGWCGRDSWHTSKRRGMHTDDNTRWRHQASADGHSRCSNHD